MYKTVTLIMAMCILLAPVAAQQTERTRLFPSPEVRFIPLDVYLDTGARPLAAYQFELKITSGNAIIVGIEGGEHKAFQEAPYYDPAALQQNRIIIAAFNTGLDLPTHKTRVARLHLQIIGDTTPQYELIPIVTATTNGREFQAEFSLIPGDQP